MLVGALAAAPSFYTAPFYRGVTPLPPVTGTAGIRGRSPSRRRCLRPDWQSGFWSAAGDGFVFHSRLLALCMSPRLERVFGAVGEVLRPKGPGGSLQPLYVSVRLNRLPVCFGAWTLNRQRAGHPQRGGRTGTRQRACAVDVSLCLLRVFWCGNSAPDLLRVLGRLRGGAGEAHSAGPRSL